MTLSFSLSIFPASCRVPARMGSAILSDLATEIVIPVCAVVGIVFALVQWVLVSRIKLSPDRHSSSSNNGKGPGYGDYLIEEEEGLNDHNVVVKCADIQTAISEGEVSGLDLEVFGRSVVLFEDVFLFLDLREVKCFAFDWLLRKWRKLEDFAVKIFNSVPLWKQRNRNIHFRLFSSSSIRPSERFFSNIKIYLKSLVFRAGGVLKKIIQNI